MFPAISPLQTDATIYTSACIFNIFFLFPRYRNQDREKVGGREGAMGREATRRRREGERRREQQRNERRGNREERFIARKCLRREIRWIVVIYSTGMIITTIIIIITIKIIRKDEKKMVKHSLDPWAWRTNINWGWRIKIRIGEFRTEWPRNIESNFVWFILFNYELYQLYVRKTPLLRGQTTTREEFNIVTRTKPETDQFERKS